MENFDDREAFVKKVYATLLVMLLSTVLMAYFFMN